MTLSQKILLGAALFTLFVLLPFTLFMLPVWDGPLPDDADLLVPIREIPDETNAFPLFMKAHEALRLTTHEERRDWADDPGAFQDEIQKYIDENQVAWEYLARGLARGDLQGPWRPTEPIVPGVTEYLELTTALMLLSETAPLMEDRVRFLVKLEGVAGILRHDEGPLINELIRRAVEALFHGALRKAARDPAFPVRELHDLVRRLEDKSPDVRRQVKMMQLEYQFLLNHQHPMDEDSLSFFLEEHPMQGFLLSAGYVYQPNNSLRLIHEIYQEKIAMTGLGSAGGAPTRLATLEWELGARRPWTPQGGYNRMGRQLVLSYFEGLNHTQQQMKRSRATHAATLLVCALNLWHREHGELPERLEELVPTHLSELPADPWDGAPMRFNRDTARVYALGDNLTDHGGSPRSDHRIPRRENAEDFVFGIFGEIDFRDAR